MSRTARLAAAFAFVCQTVAGPICAFALHAVVIAPVTTSAEEDCCPAGSHAPGQCPLHRKAPTNAPHHPAGTPMLRCCCHTADLFLAAAAPTLTTVSVAAPALLGVAIIAATSSPIDPLLPATSPPPRA